MTASWPIDDGDVARRRLGAVALTLVGVPLLTRALGAAPTGFSVPNAAFLFLLFAVVISALGGLGPGALALIASVVALDWFFVPPFHRLAVSSTEDVVTLVVFVAVTAIVASLMERSTARAKEAQRARAEADASELQLRTNELRGALLGAVSHDLRTPLASIKAAATTMLRPTITRDATEQHLLQTIDRSVDRLNTMVVNLLDSSRVRTGAISVGLESLAIEELLTGVLETRDAHLARLAINVPERVPLVAVDRILAERVLDNLIDNALRFSAPDAVQIKVVVDNHLVEVHVIDHGPGIASAHSQKVFEPFQRLDDSSDIRGVGLGLSVAKGFADAMDATLRLVDTPGGGATMILGLTPAQP